MQVSVQNRLLALNRSFYAKSAKAFDESRTHFWPGFVTVADFLQEKCPVPWRVLDVGCGNGRLLHFLRGRQLVQDYVGVDANETLLARARQKAQEHAGSTPTRRFHQLDISSQGWSGLLGKSKQFDIVFCLATLHHLPGTKLRKSAIQCMAKLLREGGYLVLSNWQPLNSSRERKKILEWSVCELTPEDVEDGDLLISWNREVEAVRYVHVMSPEEVCDLAASAGLKVESQFLKDGFEQNLNLYSMLSRPFD